MPHQTRHTARVVAEADGCECQVRVQWRSSRCVESCADPRCRYASSAEQQHRDERWCVGDCGLLPPSSPQSCSPSVSSQSSSAPLAIHARNRPISSAVSDPVGGIREPHGGISVSFRYSRLMSGLPGTTNDKPDVVHSEALAGRLRSEVRIALALPDWRLRLPPVAVPLWHTEPAQRCAMICV